MRRVVLLALLALTLPTTALANSIDYGANGTGSSPAILTGMVAANGSLSLVFNELKIDGVQQSGTNSITFSINLSSSCGADCFNIATGNNVTIREGGSIVFVGTFATGPGNDVIFNGTSLGIDGFVQGGSSGANVNLESAAVGCDVGEGQSCWDGSTDTVTAVPEPGTLGLLGTGLIALASMIRRKLRG
jgi:hypothetical protein